MVGGRNKKDGFTIFGQNIEKNSNNDMFIPDLELNLSNNNNFTYPYIFSIYYKMEDKSYYIRSYSGKGVIIKYYLSNYETRINIL